MAKEAVYAILMNPEKNQVLLVQRRDLPVWVLPGGGIDPQETPEMAVVREVLEETGLQVQILRKVAEYLPVNRLTQKTHIFECSILKGTITTNAEAKQIAFFPPDHLPQRLPPPFPLWIADFLHTSTGTLVKKIEGVTYAILCKHLLKHPILVLRYFLTKLGIRFNDTR